MQKKIKVFISFGTRPEGIKIAPLVKSINENRKDFQLTVCTTGQHREMLEQVLDFFEIVPDIRMDLMTDNQSLGSISAKIIENIDGVLEEHYPDFLIIQGDTTTAFLTALAAYYKKIRICHLEAGLRTYNKFSPFPEEINRQFVSRVADLNFAPTERAKDNLINERIDPSTIFVTGNTIVDAMQWGIEKIKKRQDEIENKEVFRDIFGNAGNKKIILVTMHRRESFGEDIKNICLALKKIAEENKSVKIVYPVHLNPNVKKPVYDFLSGIDNIFLIEPLSYQDFLWLMYKSYLIVTDSGGIQEEAPTFKKPVLVIRNFTERLESVEMGLSRLVGTNKEKIFHEIMDLLDDRDKYKSMMAKVNPYGDGKAAERIVDIIEKSFNDVI